MPRLTVCTHPGCPELTSTGRCPAHRQRASASSRGYDVHWRRTRGRYLKHHPVCETAGCTSPAVDVHHLDMLGPNGPDGHRWANLQALCHPHHAQLTARLQPGGWAAR
jgi:5-methylcytosine-specific restriction protein A